MKNKSKKAMIFSLESLFLAMAISLIVFFSLSFYNVSNNSEVFFEEAHFFTLTYLNFDAYDGNLANDSNDTIQQQDFIFCKYYVKYPLQSNTSLQYYLGQKPKVLKKCYTK